MNKLFLIIVVGISTLVTSSFLEAHGYIENPPARNWYCGVTTKPDEVLYHDPEYPVCGGAFENYFLEGYNFMSILTHAQGRKVVNPLPDNVCGFNSETFGYGETPWDVPIDWPTNDMTSGRTRFSWNISWGPHFLDTEEFVYWITKPGFNFRVGQPLRWEDFESEPFCDLRYDDATPFASPDVIPRKSTEHFDTYCTVPERSGRHVIYAEWGRDQGTYERFHSCIDAVFDGTGPEPDPAPDVVARISGAGGGTFTGTGSLALSAGTSAGEGLRYQWTLNSATPELYSLSSNNSAETVLSIAAPGSATSVTVTLSLTGSGGSDNTSVTINHEPDNAFPGLWEDLGPVTRGGENLSAGDKVAVRVVLENGQDLYFPTEALALTEANARADRWPYALSRAVSAVTNQVGVGVLREGNILVPVEDATSNRIYARKSLNASNAYVAFDTGEPGPGTDDCRVAVLNGSNPWWAGFNVATNADNVKLDFSNTGVDLSRVRFEPWSFGLTKNGQSLAVDVPDWVKNSNSAGYFELKADNYGAVVGMRAPTCTTSDMPQPPPANDSCIVSRWGGAAANPWWAGFTVGADDTRTIKLDFSSTGLDLSRVRIEPGVFTVSQSGQTVTMEAPEWVSIEHPGYFDMYADDYPALVNMRLPVCRN